MPQRSGMVVRTALSQGEPVCFEVGLLPQGPAVYPSISGVHSKSLLNDENYMAQDLTAKNGWQCHHE